MKKIVNGRLTFEVTFIANDVIVDTDSGPEGLFEAVIDNWCEGYSEQLGACLDEHQSDYDEEDLV